MPELLTTASLDEAKPARSIIQSPGGDAPAATGWRNGPVRVSVGPNLARYSIYGGAVAALLALAACLPQEGESGGIGNSLASALSRTADLLKQGLSQDYDPPDYSGPPLGQLPRYFVGDSYTYSSGRTETVTQVKDDRVVWINDLRSQFERYRNFVLPTVVTRTDRGSVDRRLNVAPEMLWPLIPGTRRQFSSEISVKVREEKGQRLFRRDWVCVVVGPEPVTVQFGVFDSVKISCDRYAHGTWQQTRTWYFVPEIGHFVRRIDKYLRQKNRDVELVSIQQSFGNINRTSQRGLEALEQRTLEKLPSGQSASWRSPDGRLAVTMTVTKTLKTEAGQFCRTFRQRIDDGQNARFVPGLACRTWNGRWVRL